MGVDMDEPAGVLGVQVAVGPDGDAEEIAQATLQLRRELLDLDVDAVAAPGGRAAAGIQGGGRGGARRAGGQHCRSAVAYRRGGGGSVMARGSPRRSIKLELGGDGWS